MGGPSLRGGERFGDLTVLRRSDDQRRPGYWVCLCDCGNEVVVRSDGLRCGDNVSCGCRKVRQLRTHGLSKTVEHKTWSSMIERCHSPSNMNFPNYGARGIRVCDRWRQSFEAFFEDMGRRPSPDHSIDRINNEGDYEPGNCRWATAKEQASNRRPARRKEAA